MRSGALRALAALVAAGCSGSTGSTGSTADDPSEGAPGGPPAVPDDPAAGEGEGEQAVADPPNGPERPAVAPPKLQDWECPAGTNPVVIGAGRSWEHRACRPPGSDETCPAGQAQFYADAGCRPHGVPCPDGGRAPSDETIAQMAPGFLGPVLHVTKRGGARGDGSAAAPFGSIGQALSSRPADGSILAVGPGLWTQSVEIHPRLAVVGWCVAQVVLQPDDVREPIGILAFRGEGGGRVANLTLGGPGGSYLGVHTVSSGGPTEVEDVRIEGASEAGVFFDEGSHGGLVRRVRVVGGAGQGVGVSACQEVRIEGLQAEGIGGSAVLAYDDVGGQAGGVRVHDLRVDGAGRHGVQLSGCPGSSVRRAWMGGVDSVGVLVTGRQAPPATGWTAELEDVWIEDPLDGPLTPARGVEINGRVRVRASRLAILGPKEFAVLAITDEPAGVEIRVDQLVVRDTTGRGLGEIYYGIGVLGRVVGSIDRAAVVRANGAGLGLAAWDGDEVPELALRDLVVADTRSPSALLAGYGVLVFDGAQVTLERALLHGNSDVGLLAAGWGRSPETRVTATDLQVRATRAASCDSMAYPPVRCEQAEYPDNAGGSGLLADAEVRLTLNRFALSDSAQSGLVVANAAVVRGQAGLIAANAIGLNLMDPSFDVTALQDIRFEDNAADVGELIVRLPDPSSLLDDLAL